MVTPTLDVSEKAALAARARIEVSERLDLQLSPLGLRAIDALDPAPGDVIVDTGCGPGQSTRQLAARVGSAGRVVGVDIAAPLLDLARNRAAHLPQVSFLQADAQCLDLPDGSVVGIYSRFGVMAFANSQAAFTFRRVLRPWGRLAFVCWRELDANELDLMPLQATGLEAMADQTPFSLPTRITCAPCSRRQISTRSWSGPATTRCPAVASTRWPRCCSRWGRSVASSGRTLV